MNLMFRMNVSSLINFINIVLLLKSKFANLIKCFNEYFIFNVNLNFLKF
jgi:hypothetical protein